MTRIRFPDAVQRLFGDAPQSRDPRAGVTCMGPGSAAHHSVLRSIRGTYHPGYDVEVR